MIIVLILLSIVDDCAVLSEKLTVIHTLNKLMWALYNP